MLPFRHCPIHNSLADRVEAPLSFAYEDFTTGTP